MPKYIYNNQGKALGYKLRPYIYTLDGTPIGQIIGSQVFKLSGEHVGELYKDMVVDKGLYYGDIENIDNPENLGILDDPGNRVAVDCEYPDVFYKLLE